MVHFYYYRKTRITNGVHKYYHVWTRQSCAHLSCMTLVRHSLFGPSLTRRCCARQWLPTCAKKSNQTYQVGFPDEFWNLCLSFPSIESTNVVRRCLRGGGHSLLISRFSPPILNFQCILRISCGSYVDVLRKLSPPPPPQSKFTYDRIIRVQISQQSQTHISGILKNRARRYRELDLF